MRMSRAIADTLRLTTIGVTLISCRCSHSAQRTSSASLHARGIAAASSCHGSGRLTRTSWRNSSNTKAPATLIVGERGDDVCLIALGNVGEIATQLACPAWPDWALMDVAGGVEATAQFADLLL